MNKPTTTNQMVAEFAQVLDRPAGLSLLFCSRKEIEAAPVEEREAYYRIVEGICAKPEACGLRFENVHIKDDRFDDDQESIQNGDTEIF